MSTSADLIPIVNRINKAFEGFDAHARSFIFLEWNPLLDENGTTESNFWRECINIHILFRECMPCASSGDDYQLKKALFSALGYQDSEIREFNSFCHLLRELRLYRCHLLNGNVRKTADRRKNIEHSFKNIIPSFSHPPGAWQFRMTEDQWEVAFCYIYETAVSLLKQMAEKISAVREELQSDVLATWKALYTSWYQSSDMCRTYLHNGFYEYYIMMDRISDSHPQEKPGKRADKAMRNDALKETVREEYANMTAYKTFEPAELSFEIVKAVLRNYT